MSLVSDVLFINRFTCSRPVVVGARRGVYCNQQGLDLMEPAADIGVGHFRLDYMMFQWYCDLVLVTLVMLETSPSVSSCHCEIDGLSMVQ